MEALAGPAGSARHDSIVFWPDGPLDAEALDRSLASLYDRLEPGGALLAAVSCLERPWPAAAVRSACEALVPSPSVDTRAMGNPLATAAAQQGVCVEELRHEEIWTADSLHPTLVAVRVVKPGVAPRRARAPRGAGILLYHRIAESGPTDTQGRCVPAHRFEAHLEVLRRDWRPMSLLELARAAAGGAPPERAIAVSFDGGYRDGLERAIPALRRFEVPATFFVPASCLDGSREHWWDALERLLLAPAAAPTELVLPLRGTKRRFATATAVDRRALFDELFALLRTAPLVEREDVMRHLGSWKRGDVPPGAPTMGRDEILRLASCDGVTIGAHGIHALSLPEAHPDLRHREIFESRSALEAALGRPVEAFSHPFGRSDPAVDELVRAAGYACAATGEPRALWPRQDPLRLPRLCVPPLEAGPFAQFLEANFG